MKIYNKVVFNMETCETLYEDSFEYEGELSKCGSDGGSSETSIDYEYNERMADIAEEQQAMAKKYYDFGEKYHWPYEKEMIAANRSLIPGQTGLTAEQIAAERRLLPGQTAFAEEQTEAGRELLKLKMPVAQQYYEGALKGVSTSEEMGKARADVESAYSGTAGAFRREMGRSGINPASARFVSQKSSMLRDKAASLAGSGTRARRYAEDQTFQRLKEASA